MNREEILEKSRKEKVDEGMVQAENKASRVGIVAFCIMFMIITIFNFVYGINNYSLIAMFFAFFAASNYPRYRFTKDRAYLLSVFCGTVSSVIFFVLHIRDVIG